MNQQFSVQRVNENKEMDVVVFDVCDTLFYSNTTFDFISFVLKQRKSWVKNMVYQLLTRKLSPVFLFLFWLNKLTARDYHKNFALKILAGLSKEELNNFGLQFYEQCLQKKKIKETFRHLAEEMEKGKKIILASSGIEPVIATIADQLKVQYICSQLEYENGIFTGSLISDCTGKKHELIGKLLNEEEKKTMTVFTDNYSDKVLIQQAKHKFVIIYGEKQKSKWSYLAPHFIELA